LAALAANAGTGLWAVTGSGTGAVRTITAPAAGITVSNGGGVAGNPTLALADDLAAVEGLATTGIVRRTGTSTWSAGTAVALTELAAQGAYTFVGNATGSSAVPTAVDIGALTAKASPVGTDEVMIRDNAASGAWKRSPLSAVSSVGSVASFNTLTGAVTTNVTRQIFTSSGTYTPTAGMLHCIIEVVGGGGGGGGAQASGPSQIAGGGGGGGGGYSRLYATAATIGASKAVTIGAAGTGAAAGFNNGGAGGTSSVGSLLSATGGAGGQAGNANSVSAVPGGAGGIGSTGDINLSGSCGGSSFCQQGAVSLSGLGGAAGSGSGGAAGTQVAAGNAAAGYGGGGSGGAGGTNAVAQAGGAGAPGIVIVTEFINL
jgi:hypothetical protein